MMRYMIYGASIVLVVMLAAGLVIGGIYIVNRNQHDSRPAYVQSEHRTLLENVVAYEWNQDASKIVALVLDGNRCGLRLVDMQTGQSTVVRATEALLERMASRGNSGMLFSEGGSQFSCAQKKGEYILMASQRHENVYIDTVISSTVPGHERPRYLLEIQGERIIAATPVVDGAYYWGQLEPNVPAEQKNRERYAEGIRKLFKQAEHIKRVQYESTLSYDILTLPDSNTLAITDELDIQNTTTPHITESTYGAAENSSPAIRISELKTYEGQEYRTITIHDGSAMLQLFTTPGSLFRLSAQAPEFVTLSFDGHTIEFNLDDSEVLLPTSSRLLSGGHVFLVINGNLTRF